MIHNTPLRRRLFDGLSSDDNSSSGQSSPREGSVLSPRLNASVSGQSATSPLLSSFNSSTSKDFSFNHGSPTEYYYKVLNNPDAHFDQIIQKASEYLSEVQGAIYRIKRNKLTGVELMEAEDQIEKTLAEVTRIASQLQEYIEEASTRGITDSPVSPRVTNAVKSREASLNELTKTVRNVRKELQIARTERERKDLLNEWSPFDRTSRTQRDAEEMISDSTERLMNSKRILLETIQSSSGTLSSLATSSQSIVTNDGELHTQTSMVSSARSLLTKYGRRASTDKLLIWLGFIFFGFCALIVGYKRLF